MSTVVAAAAALVVGTALGIVFSAASIRHLRKRLKELRAGKPRPNVLQSVTRFLFATTQIFALGWVSVSYGIAVYSTVKLYQPFPVVELSQQAITTVLGVNALKVLENIFEHNEGMVFGRSRQEDNPPDGGGEEGGVG